MHVSIRALETRGSGQCRDVSKNIDAHVEGARSTNSKPGDSREGGGGVN